MSFQSTMVTGVHGAYRWMTTGLHDLDTLRRKYPQALVGRYVAVTSMDSGSMELTDEEKRAGWWSRNGIAYSPQIQSAEDCRTERSPGGCCGFNEWYVCGAPFDLGELRDGNVFEAAMTPGQVYTFVNFGPSFALHDPEVTGLADLFWKQLDGIRPESYIADADVFLTFVSRNEGMFASVRDALEDTAPDS